jgi:hypothetical protein
MTMRRRLLLRAVCVIGMGVLALASKPAAGIAKEATPPCRSCENVSVCQDQAAADEQCRGYCGESWHAVACVEDVTCIMEWSVICDEW